MRKILLILILGIFLINFGSLVMAESCSIARPYYGSVNCKETGSWSDEIFLTDGQSWTCEVPNCRINGMNVADFSCSGLGTTSKLKITKNVGDVRECSNTLGSDLNTICSSKGVYAISLSKGDTIQVDFSCNLGGEPEGNPKLSVQYKKIALEMHYDSGENFQPGTNFCQANSVWENYKNKQLNNNELLKSKSISNEITFNGEGFSNIPSSGDIIGTLEPKQLSVGQGYWFIYEWVTRSELNAKDYQGMKVWCNPIDRSLTKLEELRTTGNNCYLIPTERLSQTVECCSSNECTGIYNNQDIYCTDDFKCGYTKSCISDYDCSGTGSSCESSNGKYNLIKSTCDKSKLDAYGKGKCVSTKEEVKCCNGQDGGTNTCGSEQYCDYKEGCKGIFRDCPSNSCCLIGGDYKEKSCSIGQCCTAQGSFVGICATDCSTINSSDLQNTGLPGGFSGVNSRSSTGITILIIFLILIVGSITFFVYVKKKKDKNKPSDKKIEKSKEKKGTEKGKHCTKCGNLLKSGSKFCTKCGRKVVVK